MSAPARVGAIVLALVLAWPALAARPPRRASAAAKSPPPEEVTVSPALDRLLDRWAQLLVRYRPDLAARYGATAPGVRFVPLDEVSAAAHVRELEGLLAQADTLAGERADTLRARLKREIADTVPGGALRRDPLLWLDVIEAATRAPFELGSANGCDRTHRSTLQLRGVPEALRCATVLMRGAQPPDSDSLEARLTRLEGVFRRDLPPRTEACKESRRRADFVEADSLAAASLVEFRHWVSAAR